jgi:hypothetical protein
VGSAIRRLVRWLNVTGCRVPTIRGGSPTDASPTPWTRAGRRVPVDDPEEVKLVLLEVLGGGVFLNTTAFAIFVCGSLISVALVAGAIGFFGKRGETAAMKRDIKTIKDNLAQTTAVTEEIKAAISGALWLKQKRMDLKWQCYAEIVENLGELHTLVGESIALESLDPEASKQRLSEASEALRKARRAGSKARLAVPAEVRTALTSFGDKWNAARTPMEQGTVARNAWMEISDIARHDLFDEPRESPTVKGSAQ